MRAIESAKEAVKPAKLKHKNNRWGVQLSIVWVVNLLVLRVTGTDRMVSTNCERGRNYIKTYVYKSSYFAS